MSLLAGFDFVSEISNATILNLIKASLKIERVPVIPPFEINKLILWNGINANVVLTVTDLTIDINSDSSLSFHMPFNKASVATDYLGVCPLDGDISFKIPLFLVDTGANQKQVAAGAYLFCWDEITGADSGRLMAFLRQSFGIDWVVNAKIEKSNDGMTVRISTDHNALSLTWNKEKTEISLQIDDGRTGTLIGKTENGKLNVYANVEGNISFSSKSEQIITDTLNKLPASLKITPDQFKALTNQMVTDWIYGMGQNVLPNVFTVVPNAEGSIQPLQFVRLDLKCIGNSNRSDQALCLLGIFLKKNISNGLPAQKTSSAIGPGHDLCVSISPGAFHSLYFCPSLFCALATKCPQDPKFVNMFVPFLPATCGIMPGYPVNGALLTKMSDSFAQDCIQLNGSFSQKGDCYTATGTFDGTISLSIANSTLIPTASMNKPSVNVDMSFWCELVAVLFGPVGIAIMGVVNAAMESAADKMAQSMVNSAFGNLSGFTLGDLGGATFDDVKIKPEGLTLQGFAPSLPLPPPMDMTPKLSISGSVLTSSETPISTGTVHESIPCPFRKDVAPNGVLEKDYPYTEYALQQSGVYTGLGEHLIPPLNLTWEIRNPKAGGPEIYPLTGPIGTVSFKTTTYYVTPLPGGSSQERTIRVNYTISNNTVTLTNDPNDGIYGFTLSVRCKDCDGTSLEAQEQDVNFMGDSVELGGNYYADVQKCSPPDFGRILQEAASQRAYKRGIVLPPIDDPDPETIIESIYSLVSVNLQEANNLLLNMPAAYGSSYYRGLHSKAASKVGLSPEAKAGVSTKARVGISKEYRQNLLYLMSAEKSKEIRRGAGPQ
jgi:hypothetical protein